MATKGVRKSQAAARKRTSGSTNRTFADSPSGRQAEDSTLRADKRHTQSTTWDDVREIAGALPGAEEGTSYGTAAFKVNGKLFVRFHQSGESVVVHVEIEEREALMRLNPDRFYITDHYIGWPWMLVRFSATGRDDLSRIIEESWRRSAPRKLVASYECQS